MLRSMYSAISGMQAFQTKLDVIGNNIANVNTFGFKAGRVDFSDVLSQTTAGGTRPLGSVGGTNPQQIGSGVKVASISTLFTQGADQTTGNPLDLALNGSGLFVVSPDGGATRYYTRAGDFSLDSAGNLVLPNGMVAMGIGSSAVSPLGPQTSVAASQATSVNVPKLASAMTPPLQLGANPDVQIGQDGSISVTDTSGTPHVVGYLVLATVPNPSGLEKVGDSLYQLSADSGAPSTPDPNSATGALKANTYQTPGQNNSASLMSGALEMSNVDLTREFTEMIVAQRGFDANSKMIGTDNSILQDIVNLKNSN